jgi:ribosomal protein S18 acetylase RimI-like enzyme
MAEALDIRFRSYEARDLVAVRDLNVAAIRSIYPAYRNGPWNSDLDVIERVYLDGGDFIVGIHASAIVAMGALRRVTGELGEIKRVGVEPGYQGRGIGRALLAIMEARAAELGFNTISLDTTEKQPIAQRFYRNHGYVEIGRRPVVYSPDVTLETIFFTKALPPQPGGSVGSTS